MDPARSEIRPLTSIRGVAALWVVLGHMLGQFDRAFNNPDLLPVLDRIARGNQFAVDIFFVLSGYVMVVAYGDRVEPSKFFLNRFARVVPLHVVTLAAAVAGFYVLLQLGLPRPDAYSASNLVFYFTLTSAWFGLVPAWNAPCWSLSAEAFAYLFFPAIQAIALRISWRGALAGAIVLGAAHVLTLQVYGFADTGTGALLRATCGFAAGGLLRFALKDRALPLAPELGVAGIVLCAALGQYGYGVPAILLLIAGLGANKTGPVIGAMSTDVVVWLGKISYSIYLLHFPMLNVADKLLRSAGLLQSSGGQALFILVFIALLLGLAHLTWTWIEKPARAAIYQWHGSLQMAGR